MKSLRRLFGVGGLTVAMAFAGAAPLAAQVIPPQQRQNPPAQNRQGQGAQSSPNRLTEAQEQEQQRRQIGDPDLENLVRTWNRSPSRRAFQGFPIFPSKLPGYGSYPRGLGQVYAATEFGHTPALPGASVPPEMGWPQWLKNQGREPLPYEPDTALLVRNVDRVWWKSPGEDAFVPLYFHDKLRGVKTGTQIEVRQVGEFELLMHGGSRLMAQGTTEITIEELSETVVSVRVGKLTRLRLDAFGREHRIGLPDGSTVIMRPKAQPSTGLDPATSGVPVPNPFVTDAFQPALLVFQRVDEPGWRSGRATLWNGGEVPIEWQHAFGTTVIASGQRVTFFLTPSDKLVPAALTSEQVVVEREGRTVRCEARADGQVSWSGARFSLAKGSVLRLDAMLGEPFARPAQRPVGSQ